ncbi:MAG: PAS domain S-box protein [Dehalococcoidia bacterium]|nr:PAS domain S-box protein [Dehalococcoidia bacterium]
MDTPEEKMTVPDSNHAAHSFAQRYCDFFDCMNDAVAVLQLDGTIVAANAGMATLTGRSLGEMRGMNIASFLSTEDFRRFVDRQNQQIKGEAVTQRYEVEWIRRDGTKVVGESVTRLLGEWGRPVGVLTITKNITEQKRIEEALREERDKAQRYLDVAGVSIEIIDANQIAILMNKKCCEMLGYTESELLGRNWFDMLTPERHRAKAKAIFAGMISGRTRLDRCIESPVVTKSGQERLIAWYNPTLLKDKSGNVVAVLGSGLDITERRRMEKALLESEERYRTLFEDSRDAIFILDRSGRVMHANRAGLELFGYTEEEIADVHLLRRAVDPTQSDDFRERAVREGYVRDYEMKLRKKNGSEIDCLLTFTVERDADGNALGYEGIVRDVTDDKRMQRNLSLYITQVTRAQEEERKRIARELHDETVQSLSALSLDIQRLAKGRKRLPEEIIRELDQIRQKVTNIADELSRLSHALRPNVIDHLGLIPALRLLVSDFSKKSGVTARLEVVGAEQRLSPETELGLYRIVQEATRNIRKHAEATEVVISVGFNDGRVTVTITDNGKGFSTPVRLEDFATMGRLGLIGMQERAQLLNGEFSIHSEPGVGTTIKVETR